MYAVTPFAVQSKKHSPDNPLRGKNIDCQLLDSFIVGEDGIYSERNDGFIEHFEEENFDFLTSSSKK